MFSRFKSNSSLKESTQTEICLQEEKSDSFGFYSKMSKNNYTDAYTVGHTLYTPSTCTVKTVSANDPDNENYIELVKETVKKASSISSVKLQEKWDMQNKMFKVSIVATLDKGFYSLPKIMKIQIKGSFKVQHLESNQYVPLSQKSYEFEAEIVPGLRIVDVKDFKGASTIESFINGNHILKFDMKYSVTIVWKRGTDVPIAKKLETPILEGKKLGEIQRMYYDRKSPDFKILTKYRAEFPCHRSILSRHGDLSKIVVKSTSLEMNDMSEHAVDVFLKYVYQVDISDSDFDKNVIMELLITSDTYNITALQEKVLDVIIAKPAESFDLNSALTIYYFKSKSEKFQKIKTKMLVIMKRNQEELKQSTAFKAMMEKYPPQAAELALALLVV